MRSAQARIDAFARRYQREFPSAVKCLLTDGQARTAYLRFPAEHWRRIRHTKLIRADLRGDPPAGQGRRPASRRSALPHAGLAALDRASRAWRGLPYTPAIAATSTTYASQLDPDHTNEEQLTEAVIAAT